MSDLPNPPKGLIDRLRHFERHQIESGDEYGAEVLHRAAEEIARLTREVEGWQNAEMQVRGMRDAAEAQVAQLQEELDKARQHNAELRKQNAVLQNDLDDWAGVPDVK